MSDNEANSETKPEAKAEPKAKAERQRRSRGGTLALLLSLLSLTATGYIAWFLFIAHPLLFRDDVPGALTSLQDTVTGLKNDTSNARDDIDRLEDAQKTFNEALRKTTESMGRNRRDWILAEAEQLMIIANQRLQLAGDFDTAAAALDIADRRLRSLSDPELLPVRKLLVDEIDKLKSADRVDIAGITLKLANMAQTVEQLPLSLDFRSMKVKPATATDEEAKTKTAPRGFFAHLWADIRSLITIRRNVESYRPLLPPQQQYFLRENLRLVLFGAQQAALRADAATYRVNLETAARWIRVYFDPDAQTVKEMLAQVQTLERAPLTAKRPDISASLAALRTLSQKRAGL